MKLLTGFFVLIFSIFAVILIIPSFEIYAVIYGDYPTTLLNIVTLPCLLVMLILGITYEIKKPFLEENKNSKFSKFLRGLIYAFSVMILVVLIAIIILANKYFINFTQFKVT